MKLQLKQGELESVSTDDFMYDLFLGGYFKPEKFLEEKSAEKVREAMKVVEEYQQLLEDNDLIEEM